MAHVNNLSSVYSRLGKIRNSLNIEIVPKVFISVHK